MPNRFSFRGEPTPSRHSFPVCHPRGAAVEVSFPPAPVLFQVLFCRKITFCINSCRFYAGNLTLLPDSVIISSSCRFRGRASALQTLMRWRAWLDRIVTRKTAPLARRLFCCGRLRRLRVIISSSCRFRGHASALQTLMRRRAWLDRIVTRKTAPLARRLFCCGRLRRLRVTITAIINRFCRRPEGQIALHNFPPPASFNKE